MGNPSSQSIQHSPHQHMQDYEYLIPISSAITAASLTGYQIAGIHGMTIGAVIGVAAGITDKLLIDYEITSKHYLTSSMLGASIMNPFQLPYHIGEIAGIAMGLIAPTGYLKNLSGIVPTIMTTATTAQYAREKFSTTPNHAFYGAAIGAFISLADEIMIYFNVSNKHYLSTTTIIAASFDFMASKVNNIISWTVSFSSYTQNLHSSATDIISNIRHISISTGIILGAYTANKTELNILDWKPISLGKKLFQTYQKLVSKEKLEHNIELFAITSTASQMLFYHAIFKESESFQIISPLYHTKIKTHWKPLRIELLKYFFFVMPIMTLSTFANVFFNNYFSRKISYLIEDSVNSEWLTNNTALKLSKSESTLTLIHHKTSDIQKISKDGSSLLGNAFFKTIGGFTSIGFIANHNSMDILGYLFIYNEFTSKISEAISERINKHTDGIRDLEAARDNIEKDITNKVEIITEREGTSYHLNKLNNINYELRNFKEQQENWKTTHSSWLQLKNFSNLVLNYLTTAYKLYKNTLDFNVRYKVLDTLGHFFALISFEMDNKANILEIEKAVESINTLINEMENNTTPTKQYNKEYTQGELSITFKNFTIYIEESGNTLVHLDYLHLTEGIYSIGGAKGSGKSSFTSKIIGLDHNGIAAEGTIIFSTLNGEPPVIISVPQTNHMPLNSTLLELFYYPRLLPKDPNQLEAISLTIQELWKKIAIGNNSTINTQSLMKKLYKVEDWSTILSGGEQKIVLLISAIITPADIKIFDEIFPAFDPQTHQRTQEIMKEYAPGCIILSIDHHIKDNGFYDMHLNLTNHTFEVIDIF